jgi:hypothetical protein
MFYYLENNDEDAVGVLKRGGEKALSLMIQNFPGPLTCDRFQEMGRLPRVLFHGPLLKPWCLWVEM